MAEFQSSVSRHFGFLTTEHDFEQRDPKVDALDAPLDASVAIAFERPDLRLTLGLGLITPGLGVSLRDNDWADKPTPPTGTRRVKSVYLEYLIEFLTDGAVQPIVPHYGDGSTRAYNQAVRRVTESLDSVLEQLAERLRSHAPQVLARDVTNRFVAASEYYDQKLRQ